MKMVFHNGNKMILANIWFIHFAFILNAFSVVLSHNITNPNFNTKNETVDDTANNTADNTADNNTGDNLINLIAMIYIYGVIGILISKMLVNIYGKDCDECSNCCKYFDNFITGILIIFYVIPIVILFGPIIVIVHLLFDIDQCRTNLLNRISCNRKKSNSILPDTNTPNDKFKMIAI
tara:strand:- start:32 stop:565 length:534 start_codon:yes stop_codon:yes gene_type:complete